MKADVAIVKCIMGELTDETNIARGFSLLLMTWAAGYVFGFVISLAVSCWLANISGPLVRSLVASYHDHKIAGQASFQILSGTNTHTLCRVSFLLSSYVYLL